MDHIADWLWYEPTPKCVLCEKEVRFGEICDDCAKEHSYFDKDEKTVKWQRK